MNSTISPMNSIPDNEIIRSAIALVNEGMRVTFPVKGNSMLPFIIGGKESVDLVKPEHPRWVMSSWHGWKVAVMSYTVLFR